MVTTSARGARWCAQTTKPTGDRTLRSVGRLHQQTLDRLHRVFFAFTVPASALVVTGALVADESLTGADIRNDSLTGADVAELTLDNPLWAIVEADGTLASAGQPGTSVEKLNSRVLTIR